MITAARLERARQIASPDPLSVVPKALKPAFLATIAEGDRVIPAQIVRLPAPHLQASEQIPLMLRPGGRIQGPKAWGSAATQQLVAGWLARQPAVAPGSVRPVVLKLEPLPGSSLQPAGQRKTRASRSKRFRSKRFRSTVHAQQRRPRFKASKASTSLPPPLVRGFADLEGSQAPSAQPTTQGVQLRNTNR